jgi:cytochrome c oxidase cbb3-type subunit 3
VSGLKWVRFAAGGLVLSLVLPPSYLPSLAGEGISTFAPPPARESREEAGLAVAQSSVDPSGRISGDPPQVQQPSVEDKYLRVPLVNNIPGAIPAEVEIKNPMANDPASATRGMQYFSTFNCIGCHAPNGGGGMGPSLSSHRFKFGADPAQHFVVIAHGAPLGMPAWARVLSENVIWDLVSYIDSISNAPSDEWGTTFSPAANLPRIEQVPAEFLQITKPWLATQPFSGWQASRK